MTLPHVHPITARGMIATLLAAAAIGRDPDAFVTVISGRVGVGMAYDGLRRVRAWSRGERFDPSHGGTGRESAS